MKQPPLADLPGFVTNPGGVRFGWYCEACGARSADTFARSGWAAGNYDWHYAERCQRARTPA